MNPMDDLLADMAAKTPAANLLVPVQTKGEDVGLPQERVLTYRADLDTLERIALTEYEGAFVFEHYVNGDVKFSHTAQRSDDPVFLEAAENYLRGLGLTMQYPTPDDHKWLAPRQFEKPALPDQWEGFVDETSGATLQPHRYYGFSEGGGLAGRFDGYHDRDEAIAAMLGSEVSTDPEQLGAAEVCVLSGQQFVERVHDLGGEEGYSVYGRFT